MDTQIFVGLLLTILPVFELRGGLPVVVEYALRNGVSVWPYFLIVLILNILLIFFVFLFLDFVHDILMKIKWYRVVLERVLRRLRRKVDKLEDKMDRWGYFALMLFVAVPLPGSGAWSGVILAWIMGLNRVKSFIAIAGGVVVAGLIILFFSLGIFG